MAAQSVTPSGSNTSQVESDVKKLLDAVTAQQKALADQQKQISDQQQEIERLKQQLSAQTQAVSANGTEASPRVVNATLTEAASTNPTTRAASDTAQGNETKESPLSFRIGAAEFTPGGFVDFENVFRSTNTGNVAATNFGNIPFSNSVAGHLTEFRITGQYSRLSLKTHATFGANDITGYVEGDLNGNDANNVFVTTNPHTARIRLYWLDLKRGKWEFLGGQSWGLMTPNRTGLSPNPSDLALGLGEDANVHTGINHSRAGTFRVVVHPNSNFAWGFGIENPQQYANGEVVFPNAFSAQVSGVFDINSATGGIPGTPNAFPDFNTKLAWDSNPAGRKFHWELGATTDSVKITVLAPNNTAGAAFTSHTKIGGAATTALNFELVKNFRFIANAMWGNGIGRYLIGLAPQAIVVPVNGSGTTCTVVGTTSSGCDAAVSMVHAGNGTAGFEWQPAPKSVFGFYYGGMYAQRNFAPDITVAANAAGLHPFVGFGFPNVIGPLPGTNIAGSGQSNNRAVQQGTVDWNQTFWRNPQYGALVLITQASYLTRAPWFVAAGAPKNAHLVMGYVSLRYVLP
jgi:hypothetical protein